MHKKRVYVFSSALIILFGGQLATVTKAAEIEKFDFTPVVLDSRDGSGATVGVEYDLKGNLLRKDFLSTDKGQPGFHPADPFGSAVIGYSAKGTVATSKERNPKNLLEFLLDAKGAYSAPFGQFSGGCFASYEADQAFSNKQFVYGLSATMAKRGILRRETENKDVVALDVKYGRVDPKDDAERQQAIGTTDFKPYYRWDFEFLYLVPIKWKKLETVELNWRYFLENGASDPVKSAGIDIHQLASIRVGLSNDMYVAYSTGKLPFDKKNDRIFEIGYSYKFK